MLHDELDNRVHTSPWREAFSSSHFIGPLPTADLGAVDSVLVSVALALQLAIAELLFCMRSNSLQFHHAVDGVNGKAEAISLIVNRQLHGSINVSLLLVTAHMQFPVICA